MSVPSQGQSMIDCEPTDNSRHPRVAINSSLDPNEHLKLFLAHGRIRVRNFLTSDSANALYQRLHRKTSWNMFYFLDNNVTRATAHSEEANKRHLDFAYEAAKRGYGYAHDATTLFPEDAAQPIANQLEWHDPVLIEFEEFLRSLPFLEFVRAVTGCPQLKFARAIATRFRQGHFMSFHSASSPTDTTGKRKAVFFLNLTPEWKPERGGLLEFRSQVADVVEAYVPCFNTLDLVTFPQGFWISPVAPFVQDPIFAISGRLYVE